MTSASAKYLRNHIKEILELVSQGNEITISYRGKTRARMVPIQQDQKAMPIKGNSQDSFFGIWADKKDIDVNNYIDDLRNPRYAC